MRLQFLVFEAMDGLSSLGLGVSAAAVGAPFLFLSFFFWENAGAAIHADKASRIRCFLIIKEVAMIMQAGGFIAKIGG